MAEPIKDNAYELTRRDFLRTGALAATVAAVTGVVRLWPHEKSRGIILPRFLTTAETPDGTILRVRDNEIMKRFSTDSPPKTYLLGKKVVGLGSEGSEIAQSVARAMTESFFVTEDGNQLIRITILPDNPTTDRAQIILWEKETTGQTKPVAIKQLNLLSIAQAQGKTEPGFDFFLLPGFSEANGNPVNWDRVDYLNATSYSQEQSNRIHILQNNYQLGQRKDPAVEIQLFDGTTSVSIDRIPLFPKPTK